ncbi:MAG TPA: FumA C-terminus/TtdB family hydratase beta subunit [Candidatus Bathyarchaeia archaeon]|nr:MAG: fumarate hydratase [Candidatus Bathyarchaeota archaeon RBG_16_48_13]HJX22935.1 FumA C-terminus/TtdB family hydratase beta subunit [Candidatus Bathyarchaeia archaeon]
MAAIRLRTPVSEADARRLSMNDHLFLSGVLITARDMAHQRALQYLREGKPLPFSFENIALFHCGPIVEKKGSEWRVVAAGPTTSSRMELVEPAFIRNFQPRIIIGKGGMGPETAQALREIGGAYCVFTGGAAVLAAKAVKAVRDVAWLDLGMAEALWMLEVKDFGPLVVAIDSEGNNLHARLAALVESRKSKVYKALRL